MKRCMLMLVVAALLGVEVLAQTNDRGIDPSNFDPTCSPCEDFDRYANGTWKTNNPIPAEYASWGTWNEVTERNLEVLRRILERTAASQHPEGTIAQKVGDYYFTAMDTAKIEADGAAPLAADLARIAALTHATELGRLITDLHLQGLGVPFDIGVNQDLVQNDRYLLYATQSGLGLPDRDYYLRKDDDSKRIRDQYLEHVARMLELLGDRREEAEAQARTVLDLETNLAQASLSRLELRDPQNYYNIKSVSEADSLTPAFLWSAFFRDLGLPELQSFSYAHPRFFAEMNRMLTERPLQDWKTYLRWHLVSVAAPYLGSAFEAENFRFYRTVLAGTEKMQPRWKRVQHSMNWKVGEALGQLYVAEVFPPRAKERALEMIGHIQEALRERLEALDWMGPDTKAQALAKLATFTPKIGYPDRWRDYSRLEPRRDSYYANARRADAFELRRQLDKLGKPIDRAEWGIPPQIVNAYYNPLLNEIVFPAAILQPPFFDADIDDPVNYGAMGAVIGHEILHGFDDQGSKFDAEGNMKNWWSKRDREKFAARSDRLVAQYDRYRVAGGARVNGQLTLGENIADLGGVTVAYGGLRRALAGRPEERIDGLTPDQRFFLSWAQVWRSNIRPEAAKLQVNTGVHAPAQFRVIGPLVNLREFHQAFGCREGDRMVNPPTRRVAIW